MRELEPLREPNAQERRRLARWRLSTFYVVILGYVGYYFCRANLYTALPLLSEAFGYTNTELGLIALYSEVVYSLGKFVNGPLGDRIGGKPVFVLGMVGAIACNAAFAASASLPAFILIWSICRFFLSMGWGGVLKMIASWYEPERNGTIMGLISLSFQFGGVAINLFAGSLVALGVGWQGLFLYPAGLLTLILICALVAAKDGPESVSPGVRFGRSASRKEALSGLDRQPVAGTVQVLLTLLRLSMFRRILVFSVIANFLRSIFLFWSPKLLVDLGMGNANAILSSAAFPLLGGIGTVLLGWYSDRLASKGDRARLMALMLSGLTLSLLLISFLVADGRPHHALIVALIGLSGFFLLGPYSMSAGALTIDIAGPRGAATCAGFIDGVGYFGGALSTWLAGYTADRYGWSLVFQVLAAAAALATITALLISRAYRRELNLRPGAGESPGARRQANSRGAVAVLALAALAPDHLFAQTVQRPNVVVVLTNDLRPDELGAFGHPFVRTPHSDRLRREGALFGNAFVTTPLSSPSRASFLTDSKRATTGSLYGGVVRGARAARGDRERLIREAGRSRSSLIMRSPGGRRRSC